MNKTVLIIITILAIFSSLAMYYIGTENSRLTELLDFFWFPLPLGATTLILVFKKKED